MAEVEEKATASLGPQQRRAGPGGLLVEVERSQCRETRREQRKAWDGGFI